MSIGCWVAIIAFTVMLCIVLVVAAGEDKPGAVVSVLLVAAALCLMWSVLSYEWGRKSAFKQLGYQESTKVVTTVEKIVEEKK